MLLHTIFLCIALLSPCFPLPTEKDTMKFVKELENENIILEATAAQNVTYDPKMKNECLYGDGAPKRQLELLRTSLIHNCGSPVTPAEAQQQVEYRNFLIKLFSRFKVKNEVLPDPSDYLTEFTSVYQKIGKRVLTADLDAYKQNFANYSEAIVNILSEMQYKYKTTYVEPKCLLRKRIFKANFNYLKVANLIDELNALLKNLQSMARACGIAIHSGEVEKVDEYMEDIDKEVNHITTFVDKWYNDSLKSAWPAVHHQILDEHIIRYKSSSEVDMKNAVDLARQIIDNTGVSNFTYDVIIVSSEKRDRFSFHNNNWGHRCSLNKGAFGFDTIIRRASFNPGDQLEKSEQMNKIEATKKLQNIVQHEMDGLYRTEFSFPQIIETLTREIAPIYGEKPYMWNQDSHCFSFVRAWAPRIRDPCPKIQYFTSSSNSSGNINALSYTRARNRLIECQEYRFFYFD